MTSYQGGRIVRIKVKDFMTYDDFEIFPKKGLNIIIGLNGSGKSSLLSAICLGLAGKPQFTGKSTHLVDFIKHGKQKAVIEIELEDPIENIVIRRIIEGDKSAYFIRNLKVQYNDVLSVIRKYNIDVGNLCQFLPQEKVADFSRMDQKQRLEIMVQAIGEPTMYTQFNDLKQMKAESTNQEKELLKLQNFKASQVQLNEVLKVEVDKHEESLKLQKHLETWQLQKKCIEHAVYQSQLKELKEENEKLRTLKNKIRRNLNKMESDFNTLSSQRREQVIKIKKAKLKSTQNLDLQYKFQKKLSDLHAEIQSAKIEYENRINEKRNHKEKLLDLKKQIQALKNLNEQSASKKIELQQNLAQNSSQYEKNNEDIAAIDSQLESIKLQINQHEYRNQSFLAEMSRLRNKNNIQMENLKHLSRDTYEAVCWLEQNKSSFSSAIFHPPLLSVKIERDEDRKFVESSIGQRDLKTFICTDATDLKRLVNVLRTEKKLKVNIGLAPPQGTRSFQTQGVSPKLRQLGVRCFVSNLFTAPEPVMRYLCTLSKLHEIPVCNANAVYNTEELLKTFRMFYTPNEKISGIRSRYGNRNLTIRKDTIFDNKLLQCSTSNSDRIQELNANIEEAKQQTENLTSEATSYEKQRNVFERDQEQLRQQRNVILENVKRIANIEGQLKQKIELYNRKEAEFLSEGDEKKNLSTKICAANNARMKILSDMNKLGVEFVSFKLQNVKDVISAKYLTKKLMHLGEEIQENKNSYKDSEHNLNAKLRESQEIQQKVLELTEYVKSHKSYLKSKKKYMKFLENDGSNSEELLSHMPAQEAIEQSIVQIQAKLDLNYEDNKSVLQEYQNRQMAILDVAKQIEHSENTLRHLRNEMEQKKQQWLPALESHIRIINEKFSHYYKLLNCAGEISLEIGDDPNDFAHYGLQVRLKYRDNEPFSVLSPDHHSGGERNIASIIFILSLQELTTVPFRCVDEINQGMDATNERRMYEFIASDAAKAESCSQYFLLTPKLLKNLSYHGNVAVHVIFNSKYLTSGLNVKNHLRIAARSM